MSAIPEHPRLPLQDPEIGLDDRLESYDEVTQRVRPMSVAVSYHGYLPPESQYTREEGYRLPYNEIRKRYVSIIDGVEAPFHTEQFGTLRDLDNALQEFNMPSDIREKIIALIREKKLQTSMTLMCHESSYDSPTHGHLENQQSVISVVISHADRVVEDTPPGCTVSTRAVNAFGATNRLSGTIGFGFYSRST